MLHVKRRLVRACVAVSLGPPSLSHSGLRRCLVRHVRGRFILARAASCGLIRHGFVRRIPPPQSTCSAPLHFIMRAATRGTWIVPLRIGSDDSKIEMAGAAQRRRSSCEDGGNASQEHGLFRRSEASTVSLPGAPRRPSDRRAAATGRRRRGPTPSQRRTGTERALPPDGSRSGKGQKR